MIIMQIVEVFINIKRTSFGEPFSCPFIDGVNKAKRSSRGNSFFTLIYITSVQALQVLPYPLPAASGQSLPSG